MPVRRKSGFVALAAIVAALVVTIVMAGCRASTGGTIHPPEQLGPALLTATDLGSGWTAQPPMQVFTTRAEGIPSIDPMKWCPAAKTTAAELTTLAGNSGAIVGFKAPKSGHTSHLVQEQLWSNQDAVEYVNRAAEVVKACTGVTWNDPDGNPITMSALAGPKVGNRAVHLLEQIETTAPYGTMAWRTRTAIVRVGATVLVLEESDVQTKGSTPMMSDADWSALVTKAVARVTALDAKK